MRVHKWMGFKIVILRRLSVSVMVFYGNGLGSNLDCENERHSRASGNPYQDLIDALRSSAYPTRAIFIINIPIN